MVTGILGFRTLVTLAPQIHTSQMHCKGQSMAAATVLYYGQSIPKDPDTS